MVMAQFCWVIAGSRAADAGHAHDLAHAAGDSAPSSQHGAGEEAVTPAPAQGKHCLIFLGSDMFCLVSTHRAVSNRCNP